MSLHLPRSNVTRTASLMGRFALFLLLTALSSTAFADHCKWRFAAGFQLVMNQQFAGMKQEQVTQAVHEMFGPRQAVCEETSYRYFLGQFTSFATTAFHRKGADQEGRLRAAQEILKLIPSQVFYKNTQAKVSAYKQIRADLGVVATEVGITPSIQALLDAVDKLGPPLVSRRPEPMNDDAIPVKVPATPLPPWAVISLYEIYDHAQHNQNGAVMAKTALILEWMKLVTSGVQPQDIKMIPAPGVK